MPSSRDKNLCCIINPAAVCTKCEWSSECIDCVKAGSGFDDIRYIEAYLHVKHGMYALVCGPDYFKLTGKF